MTSGRLDQCCAPMANHFKAGRCFGNSPGPRRSKSAVMQTNIIAVIPGVLTQTRQPLPIWTSCVVSVTGDFSTSGRRAYTRAIVPSASSITSWSSVRRLCHESRKVRLSTYLGTVGRAMNFANSHSPCSAIGVRCRPRVASRGVNCLVRL